MRHSYASILTVGSIVGCSVQSLVQNKWQTIYVGDLLNQPFDNVASLGVRWFILLMYLIGTFGLIEPLTSRQAARMWDGAVIACIFTGFLHANPFDLTIGSWSSGLYHAAAVVALTVAGFLLWEIGWRRGSVSWFLFHTLYLMVWTANAMGTIRVPSSLLALSLFATLGSMHACLIVTNSRTTEAPRGLTGMTVSD